MARKLLSRLPLLVSLLAGIASGGCGQITQQEVDQELNTRTPTVQEFQTPKSTNTHVLPSNTAILTPTYVQPSATPTITQTSTLTSTLPATATLEPTEDLMRTALTYLTKIEDDVNGDGRINQEDAFLRIKEYRPLSILTSNEPEPYNLEIVKVDSNGRTTTNINFESAYLVQIDGYQVPIIVYNGEYFILPIGGGEYPAPPTPTNTPTSIPTLDVRSYVEGLGYALYEGKGVLEVLGGLGLSGSLSDTSPEIISRDGLTATLNSRIATVEGSLGSYTFNLYRDSEGNLYGPVVHEVESGETLGRIAGNYDVDLGLLKKVNPQIKDPNNIGDGQGIVIPVDGVEVLEYMEYTLPTPTSIPSTPIPEASQTPESVYEVPSSVIVILIPEGLERVNLARRMSENLSRTFIKKGITSVYTENPEQIADRNIGLIFNSGHTSRITDIESGLPRFDPEIVFYEICNGTRIGKVFGPDVTVIYSSSDGFTSYSPSLSIHLDNIMNGKVPGADENSDGYLRTSELVKSYGNIMIPSLGFVRDVQRPCFVGPDRYLVRLD